MNILLLCVAAPALTAVALIARARLLLSAAKHRSLTGHARLSRQFAKLVPYYEYNATQVFCADDAPASVAQRRRDAFQRMSDVFARRFVKSSALSAAAHDGLSDMQLVARNRVPFQFAAYVRKHLKSGSFVESSNGVLVTDLDGNRFYDVTGSYGVNVFGYDFYKDCIARGAERVQALGPLLGAYHPVVADNVRRLRDISGMDEVSFHMSGTEAVMQAVRLARYHTRRSRIVRFCGAYHGWWDDVQPGVGNPMRARDTYTLADMSDATLKVLRTRSDIACVLVNPLQGLHPNGSAPADSMLLDSARKAHFDRDAYGDWLKRVRRICTERGIALIFDEVFVGFRIALGGAQEYFGVQADLVTYGKTLGGGLPVGVVCGKSEWMQRFRDDRPADICFARGTFNSHPYVMGAMQEFLLRLDSEPVREIYRQADRLWNTRAGELNERLRRAEVPVQVANLGTIWTVLYTQPSRYNWMLQFYLREHAIALSWVGTGRLIFSFNYSHDDYQAFAERFVAAAQAMLRDGWWWQAPHVSNKWIKRRVFGEILRTRIGRHALSPAAE